MSDIQDITSVVNSASSLLDDIRGGAITRMKAQHDESMQQFGTERQGALNSFADEKSQSLNEFNSQKNAALNSFDQQGQAKINEVQAHLASSRDSQTHMRLTKNQALIPNEDGSFPLHWTKGFIKGAKIVETVQTGTPTEERSPLAREFLKAINADTSHFAGRFHIWEIEINPHRLVDGQKRESYFLYQYLRYSQAITLAAVVKHIRGVVPSRYFCQDLQANQPAKVCGVNVSVGISRNGYTHTTTQVHGQDKPMEETTVIQIALPAAVTGDVDISKGAWGQFPYISEQAYD